MASRRLAVTATTADALSDEDIRRVETPSLVNFFAASVTNGDQVGLRLNKTIIVDDGECNIEASADVIDSDRDQVTFNTLVGRGQLRVPVPTVTTELQFLISVEPFLAA